MRTAVYSFLIVAAPLLLGACKTDTYVPNARPPATTEPGVDVVNRAPAPEPMYTERVEVEHAEVKRIEVEPGSTVIIVNR